MLLEAVKGSHYEMGIQYGKIFRHCIHAAVHSWYRHDFQSGDAELEPELELLKAGEEQFAPWIFDELKGIAAGAHIDYPDILRNHFRYWNHVPKKGFPEGACCTAIGMLSDKEGVIVGGNLDDPRRAYGIVRRVPVSGLAHVMINWYGAGWGHNGMNEAGLCVAQASLGGYTKFENSLDTPCLRTSMGTRILLEKCSNVQDSLELLKKMRCESNFIIGDAKGNLVSCQCKAGFDPVLQFAKDHDNMVFSTNHIHMPELIAMLKDRGSKPIVPKQSRLRYEVLLEAKKTMPRNLDTLQALLRSHKNYPDSLCRDSNACSTYGLLQKYPGTFFVAERPPCRNSYQPFKIKHQ